MVWVTAAFRKPASILTMRPSKGASVSSANRAADGLALGERHPRGMGDEFDAMQGGRPGAFAPP
jgi:hypothetical protein